MKIVVDCETGGLDPRQHSLFTAGFVHIPSFESFFLEVKEPLFVTTPEALRINELDLWSLSNALPPYEAVRQLEDWVLRMYLRHESAASRSSYPRVTPVGHNVSFDRGFLQRLYHLSAGENRSINAASSRSQFDTTWSYRCLDTCAIARFLKDAGLMPGLVSAKLDDLICFFEIKLQHPRHSALGDAFATAEIYLKMVEFVQGTRTSGGFVPWGQSHTIIPCSTSESSITDSSDEPNT